MTKPKPTSAELRQTCEAPIYSLGVREIVAIRDALKDRLSTTGDTREGVLEEAARAAEEVNVPFCNMIAREIRALKSKPSPPREPANKGTNT